MPRLKHEDKKKLSRPLLICLVSFALLAGTVYSRADDGPLLTPATPMRNIYLLFYKMVKRAPDLDSAIQATDAYKKADDSNKPQVLADQKNKLRQQFEALDPKTMVIISRSSVDMKVELGKFSGLHAKLPGSTSNKNIYFPYSWGGVNIALIPDKIEPFLDIPLGLEQTSAASAKINSSYVTMVIEMLPLAADGSSAMKLDGTYQWLLMTKVVGVTYYTSTLKEIWSWQDPAYKRPTGNFLQDLKK